MFQSARSDGSPRDWSFSRRVAAVKMFQSARSDGSPRDHGWVVGQEGRICFNPRAATDRRATGTALWGVAVAVFQSARSAGAPRDDQCRVVLLHFIMVSIRAKRRSASRHWRPAVWPGWSRFNPREAPERLATPFSSRSTFSRVFQSARSAGAPRDHAGRCRSKGTSGFNPREAPERLATQFQPFSIRCIVVSIRAKRRSASRLPGQHRAGATHLVSIRAKRRSASRRFAAFLLAIFACFNPREAPERLATRPAKCR